MLRLLKQLTEVYSTLKISSLAAMVPFATMGEIEAIIVDAVRYDYLQVREASGKVCVWGGQVWATGVPHTKSPGKCVGQGHWAFCAGAFSLGAASGIRFVAVSPPLFH